MMRPRRNASPSPSSAFRFPSFHSFPPFFALQQTLATRQVQLQKWSLLIQAYCRFNRLWRLSLIDALQTPLFHNTQIRKQMSLHDARDIIDWMTKEDGQQRAEWVVKEGKGSSAWIYWRRPEEWAEVLSSWVEETGQKSTVLTLYELTNGEATASQEFYGMDADILHKSLSILVKRGRAQVFGAEDQRGVKFF